MNTVTATLPADPDGQNDDRASWAHAALKEFASITGMDTAGEDDETIFGDLLADMMHWCDRNSVSFEAMLERARSNYEAETSPE